jgi:hypothetical protein
LVVSDAGWPNLLPTIPTVYIEGNHYEEWFDYLDAQEDFLDDAIDGTTATYADFFLAKTDLGKDVSPSFHVARDAYFAAAPFWIDDEVEAAFLEADELDIVCATTAEANATTARLLTRPQRHIGAGRSVSRKIGTKTSCSTADPEV